MSEPRDESSLLPSATSQDGESLAVRLERVEGELSRTRQELQARTQELAESWAVVRATFDATTDAILVTDGRGRITSVSAKYGALWPIDEATIAAGDHRQVIDTVSLLVRDPVAFRARLQEIDAASPGETRDVIELRDGRVIERVTRVPMVGERAIGRVWCFRDETHRGRAEEARFRLAALVESSDDAIISKTLDGTITSWNGAAARMFGYTAAEAVGRSITILIPPAAVDTEQEILATIRRGERIASYETIRLRKDGTPIHVALTVSPIRGADGAIVGASKIARDVTERKLAAREREALLNAERAARAEAERVNLVKDEFLANLSHELRTPLNAILGWADILGARPAAPDDLKRGLETITRNARLQSQLVEDLLDMSGIISGKTRLDIQEVDLASVVEQAVNSSRPAMEAKGVRLRTLLHPRIGMVRGDPNRLQQVVWNLLTNAVKFTERDGCVDVRVDRAGPSVEVTVQDTGQGIKPELLPHVFDRFRQGDSSTTRARGGLGLGLSIVKHLVELHGGTVHARSAGEGHGTTFVVSLPVASDPRRRAPDGSRLASSLEGDLVDLEGVRVLVIDDDDDARELLRRILVGSKAEVVTASGAARGLEAMKGARPDVLVCDVGMPEMDGYEFIARVRRLATEEGGYLPAIALTAFARAQDRARALRAGYQLHLAKPIEAAELLASVASLVGRVSS